MSTPYNGQFGILADVKVGQQNKSSFTTLANSNEEH